MTNGPSGEKERINGETSEGEGGRANVKKRLWKGQATAKWIIEAEYSSKLQADRSRAKNRKSERSETVRPDKKPKTNGNGGEMRR